MGGHAQRGTGRSWTRARITASLCTPPPATPRRRAGDHAMGQRGHRERFHVVGQDEVAPVRERAGPRRAEQREGAARAHPQRQERRGARRRHQRHEVVEHGLVRAHAVRRVLEREHRERRRARARGASTAGAAARRGGSPSRPARRGSRCGCAGESGRAATPGSGKVPSYSCGFCVASTMNGLRQHVRGVVEGDLRLVHRLEQARLGLGRGAVDLVGEHDVGEERAGLERRSRRARAGRPRCPARRRAACPR